MLGKRQQTASYKVVGHQTLAAATLDRCQEDPGRDARARFAEFVELGASKFMLSRNLLGAQHNDEGRSCAALWPNPPKGTPQGGII